MKAAPIVEPSGFFVLRTPLLPIEELHAWSADLSAPSLRALDLSGAAHAGRSDLEAALAHDRELLRARLREVVARPEVRQALFVASPSLEESLPLWLMQPDGERGQKIERALVRYFVRMTARPTPFGLFAGYSLGRLGETTQLTLEARDRYRLHTRLDGDYLALLGERLGRDRELRRTLSFTLNTSLYRLAGGVRYTETVLEGRERSYRLVVVERDAYLDRVLARAESGARLDDLVTALIDDDITRDDAEAYIHELIDAQLIVSALEPLVTGTEPLADLTTRLYDAGAVALADVCAAVADELRAGDAAPPGLLPARYRAVAAQLEPLPAPVELARLFQVDLCKPAPAATLGPEPLAELARALAVLHRLRCGSYDSLARFRDAFVARYDQREVPLCEALDEELGIGFERSNAPSADAAPLVAGLRLGRLAAGGAAHDPGLPERLRLLSRALSTGAREIVLDDATIARLAPQSDIDERRPLPDAMAVMATLTASSAEALARGDFRLHFGAISAQSGAQLLGRFCHGDAALTEAVTAHLRREEARRPEALFVELAHLPEGHIGNVVLRPLLRDYELAFLGRSGAPADHQLRLEDLDVSVRDGRVILRARRLDREIIVRASNAHNFRLPSCPGVYRFLCALQYEGVEVPWFEWGALSDAPFLPRVRTGRTIVAPAQWQLDKSEVAPLVSATGAAQYLAAQALRQAHGWPRTIALVDSDNILPVDLDNVLAIETFAQLIKDRARVTVQELGDAGDACVYGPEGRFTHELIVPLISTAPPTRAAAPPRAPSSPTRRLTPGQEWLYAKLYTGTATATRLLTDEIAPLVRDVMASGAADSWFFIRYSDPEWHLRLRFHGDADRLRGEVEPLVAAVAARAIAGGRAWRLQLDTYEREIERYGGEAGLHLSERLFAADSDAVLEMLAELEGDAGREAVWRLTLRGLDQLLDDLGFVLDDKLLLMQSLRAGFASEHAVDANATRLIGERFRGERRALEALLDRDADAESPYAPALAALARRSARVRPIGAALRAASLSVPLSELAAAQLHMHANRMLASAARAQELVLYDFLQRLYEGQLARARAAAKRPASRAAVAG